MASTLGPLLPTGTNAPTDLRTTAEGRNLKTTGQDGPAPNVIRAACRSRLYAGLEVLSSIAIDPEAKDADKIRALDTLGRFGLGAADQAAVHIVADGGTLVVGVVHLPALDPVEEWPGEDVPGQPGPVENGPEGRPLLLTSGGE